MIKSEEYKIRRRLSTKRWRENNPEKVKEYRKLYEQRDSVKEYRKKYRKSNGATNTKRWRDKHPDKAKDASLRYTYGITIDEYNIMFDKQEGLCAICFKPPTETKPLCVDHDHDTDTDNVRGLLCRACNSGLGHFQDDFSLIERAVIYLSNAPSNSNK